MNYNAKRAKLSGVIYIILALMLATIMCVTFFTAIASRKESTIPEETAALPGSEAVTEIPSDLIIPSTDDISPADAGISAILPPPSDSAVALPDETAAPVIAPEPPAFIMPVDGIITVSFSGDVPVFSVTMNDYRVHQGIDIETANGSDVLCCADGIITEIRSDALLGTCISVDHGGKFVSVYRGLSEELPEGISEGTLAESGTVIGSVDEGALFEVSQPPHLHFELIKAGVQIDPLSYLPYNAEAAAAYYGE